MNRRSAAIALIATAALTLTPAAAQAERQRVRDAHNDVVAIKHGRQTPAPDVPNADIHTLVTMHTRTTVELRAKYADLDRTFGLIALFRTPTQGQFSMILFDAGPGPAQVILMNDQDEEVDCPGLKHRVDVDRDLAVVQIPRGCLRDPAWVRIGAGSSLDAGSDGTYVDDPRLDGRVNTKSPVFGPRLAAG